MYMYLPLPEAVMYKCTLLHPAKLHYYYTPSLQSPALSPFFLYYNSEDSDTLVRSSGKDALAERVSFEYSTFPILITHPLSEPLDSETLLSACTYIQLLF